MTASAKSIDARSTMKRDRATIEEVLKDVLVAHRKSLAHLPALEPSLDALFATITSPGKRIRPLLFAGSYRAFSGNTDEALPEHVVQIAVALEIFHGFLLIHDDVIDQSTSRRGEPTLHKHIETQDRVRPRNAECSAIVLGDILQGFVFELLVHEDIEAGLQRDLIRYFARMIQLTGAGEALEIHLWDRPLPEVPESWIKSVYELKTALYTFESPLHLGALLAGADTAIYKTIREASVPLGVAFQIENDLHEIGLDFESFKEVAYDLKCGVKTLYLKRLYSRISDSDQLFLESVLAGDICALEHQARLHRLLQSETTRGYLESEAMELFAQAEAITAQFEGDPAQKTALEYLHTFILSNRKHSEAKMVKVSSAIPAS